MYLITCIIIQRTTATAITHNHPQATTKNKLGRLAGASHWFNPPCDHLARIHKCDCMIDMRQVA